MPRARKYPDNAARQKAYRERKKRAERVSVPNQGIVRRVMAAEGRRSD